MVTWDFDGQLADQSVHKVAICCLVLDRLTIQSFQPEQEANCCEETSNEKDWLFR